MCINPVFLNANKFVYSIVTRARNIKRVSVLDIYMTIHESKFNDITVEIAQRCGA